MTVQQRSGGYDPTAFAEIAKLEASSWWFRSRNRLIADSVARHFPQAADVLEIGCGTGYTIGALRDGLPASNITGTELIEEGLAVARQRWPDLTLRQADACALPFGSEFDLVAAFDVLEHIDDDRGALAELYRVLRPGGGLIVTVPQHRWLWSDADDYAYHARRYTRSELLARLREAGFGVGPVSSFVSVLLPLMLLSRLRSRGVENYDPWAEFRIPRIVNRLFELIGALERHAIARGASFPAGGSLLALATKPLGSAATPAAVR
jgi:SAM-dependent methyltransferase